MVNPVVASLLVLPPSSAWTDQEKAKKASEYMVIWRKFEESNYETQV
jgi:hypothetical protein